jgi:5-methylcytosine-specific restriction enzyme A
MLDAGHLTTFLVERFGVPLIGEAFDDSEGQGCRFHPDGIARTQGFQIEVRIGWRTVAAEFSPGTFAAGLLGSMAGAGLEQKAAFTAFIRAAVNDGATVMFRVNDAPLDALNTGTWPATWRSLSLSLQKGPMLIDAARAESVHALAATWASRILGPALALMPLERVHPNEPGEVEGGITQVLLTRHERSRINRAACIEVHGTCCKVCGLDFSTRYGAIGQGYIEIHHIEPVGTMAAPAVVDPSVDLVPVCANCHAMLHRRTPPYTVNELRAMIVAAAQAGSPLR